MGQLPSARMVAVRVLRELDRQQGFSNRILGQHLERYGAMAPRDRGLATTLVYGVLRHRIRLDLHIDRHAKRPKGLRGEVRQALRVGVYERLELGRPGAIVHSETSKIIRTLDRGGSLAAAVQAILSRVDSTGPSFDAEIERGKPLDVLEQRWSIPRWLAGRWLKQLGPELALRRAERIATPPPVDLRLDLNRTNAETLARQLQLDHPGIQIMAVPGQPQALRVRGGGDLFYGPLHAQGLFSVQGLAAQQAARMLDPKPGQRVLDACSGMGVKSLQLAELMQRKGTIVAADTSDTQLGHLADLRQRGQLGNCDLTLHEVRTDLCEPTPALDDQPFDAVLLDAPCTGLGNLARHPEVRYHRCFDDIAARTQLQSALLERCLARTRSGGILVYAVCSFAPEEGPDLVRATLENRGATLEEERTLTPEHDTTEGFYVGKIRVH